MRRMGEVWEGGRWVPLSNKELHPSQLDLQYSKVRSEDSATRASYCVDMYTISTYAVSVEIRHRPLLW
jgi:hypothetical protein